MQEKPSGSSATGKCGRLLLDRLRSIAPEMLSTRAHPCARLTCVEQGYEQRSVMHGTMNKCSIQRNRDPEAPCDEVGAANFRKDPSTEHIELLRWLRGETKNHVS